MGLDFCSDVIFLGIGFGSDAAFLGIDSFLGDDSDTTLRLSSDNGDDVEIFFGNSLPLDTGEMTGCCLLGDCDVEVRMLSMVDPLALVPFPLDPLVLDPLVVDPLGVDPLGVDPLGVDPLVMDPLGIDILGIEPLVVDPLVVEALVVEPFGVEFLAVEPLLVNPLVVDPLTVDSLPIDPFPDDPLLVDPLLVDTLPDVDFLPDVDPLLIVPLPLLTGDFLDCVATTAEGSSLPLECEPIFGVVRVVLVLFDLLVVGVEALLLVLFSWVVAAAAALRWDGAFNVNLSLLTAGVLISFSTTSFDWLEGFDAAVVEGELGASFFSFNLNFIFGAGAGVVDCDETD